MIGQIGPLVKADARNRLLWLHIAGGILGAAALGVLLATFGKLVMTLDSQFAGVWLGALLPFALVYGASVDLGILQRPRLRWSRQTPGFWRCAFGPSSAAFAWGFDVSLGFSTKIVFHSFLAIPFAVIAIADVAIGAAIMVVFGIARTGGVAVAVASSPDTASTCSRINARTGAAGAIVGSSAVALAAALLFVHAWTTQLTSH